jgi:hypothetical protein
LEAKKHWQALALRLQLYTICLDWNCSTFKINLSIVENSAIYKFSARIYQAKLCTAALKTFVKEFQL